MTTNPESEIKDDPSRFEEADGIYNLDHASGESMYDEEVEARIDALRQAVEGDENIMPYLVEAAKAYATEGEMMGVLRDAYGTYEDPGVF